MPAHCPDQKLITSPKTFYIQKISSLLGLKATSIPAGNLAFPYHRHLKSSSPQMPVQDYNIIPAVFAGSVISAGFGKIVCISPSAHFKLFGRLRSHGSGRA
jgi:hypothetical protein